MNRPDPTTARAPSAPVNRLDPAVRSVAVVVAPPAPVPTAPRVAVAALLLLGVGLRAAALASDRALWIDEAMLALNLLDRSPGRLFDRLDYNQGAPAGFLLAAKAAVSALGPREWAFRLVPFLASVLGLLAFARVAPRVLPGPAAVLAVALAALSPHLIAYAAECKQYAGDAAAAVLLLWAALGLLDGQGGLSRWAFLAAAGAVAVWCSHPAAFVLGGIGTALLARAAVERDRPKVLAAGATVAAWLVSFTGCYLVCLKQLGSNKYLAEYWAGHFLPHGPGAAPWLVDHAVAFFTTPGGFSGAAVPLGGFAAALALIGLRELARDRWPVALALALPAALVVLASALHKYPVGGRLMLFLVPFAVLLVARGAWDVISAVRQTNRFAGAVLLGLMVAAPAWAAAENLRRPSRAEQLPPVLAAVRAGLAPNDRVFVYYGAVPAFLLYTRGSPFPDGAVTLGTEHRDDPAAYRAELDRLRGRVWVVVAHRHKDEEAVMRAALDGRGRCAAAVAAPGAAAYLYELPE